MVATARDGNVEWDADDDESVPFFAGFEHGQKRRATIWIPLDGRLRGAHDQTSAEPLFYSGIISSTARHICDVGGAAEFFQRVEITLVSPLCVLRSGMDYSFPSTTSSHLCALFFVHVTRLARNDTQFNLSDH